MRQIDIFFKIQWTWNCSARGKILTKTISGSQILQNTHWKFWGKYWSVSNLFSRTKIIYLSETQLYQLFFIIFSLVSILTYINTYCYWYFALMQTEICHSNDCYTNYYCVRGKVIYPKYSKQWLSSVILQLIVCAVKY